MSHSNMNVIKLPNRSNQAMQLTASKPAIYASRVCRRESMLRFYAQRARGS